MDFKDWGTPLISVAIAPIFIYVKDWLQNRFNNTRSQRRALREQQFTKVYNRLYVYYLKHYNELEISLEEEAIEIDENQYHIERFTKIDFDLWNRIIEDVTSFVYENIHLLSYRDWDAWSNFALGFEDEIVNDERLYEIYSAFKKFLRTSAETYWVLYRDYHDLNKELRKKKIKEINGQIISTKSNPFYDKNERKNEIRKLKQLKKKKKQYYSTKKHLI